MNAEIFYQFELSNTLHSLFFSSQHEILKFMQEKNIFIPQI